MSFIRGLNLLTGRHDGPVKPEKIHVLVLGDATEAATLFGYPVTTGVHFSLCAGGNGKTAVHRQPGRRYDWILVNATSFDGSEMDLIQSLRTAGFFLSGRKPATRHACGVEWLADGRLQMHCCRQGSLQEACASSQFDLSEDDSFVFEYQAPVNRAK